MLRLINDSAYLHPKASTGATMRHRKAPEEHMSYAKLPMQALA